VTLVIGGRRQALAAVLFEAPMLAHCGAAALLAAPLDLIVRAAATHFAVVLAFVVRAPAARRRVAVLALLVLLAMGASLALVAVSRHLVVSAQRRKLQR